MARTQQDQVQRRLEQLAGHLATATSEPSEPETKLSVIDGLPTIDLKKLLEGDEVAKRDLERALGHIATALNTGALRTTTLRFNTSGYATDAEKEQSYKKLHQLLREKPYKEEDCRRGRALFTDPADEENLVLTTYQLHRSTSIPQSMDLFAESVNKLCDDPYASLESVKDFYFQSLGLSLNKCLKDNERALVERGVDKGKIDKIFEMLRVMAGAGYTGEGYYQALLASDILMQQGELSAPVQPMRDFWQYAINAGIPMGRPEPVPGKTPTFSSVISVPGYNAVEPLHPAYGAQMMARLGEFIASARKVAKENGVERPTIIDAGPCTGTILIPTAEMYPDIDFVAVEPDAHSCAILRQALKERGIKNVKVVEKCMQDISLKDDLDGQKICGMYSSFAAHHMPLPQVLAKLNEIGYPEFDVHITDEWTATLGNQAAVRKELMKYHLPIILERSKLTFEVDLDELQKKSPRISSEEISLIRDFTRDATILYDLVCNDQDKSAHQLLEKMKSYNVRYADIFEEKAKRNDKEPLDPTVAILLFGIQEFGALHQGAIHYSEEHKGPENAFVKIATKDFGMKSVGETVAVLTVGPAGVDEGGIYSTFLAGASSVKKREGDDNPVEASSVSVEKREGENKFGANPLVAPPPLPPRSRL